MGYGIRELEDFLHDNYEGGYHGVLGRKISHWHYNTDLQFDEQGRAVIGKHKIEIGLEDYLAKIKENYSMQGSLQDWSSYITEVLKGRKLINEAQERTLLHRTGASFGALVTTDLRSDETSNRNKYCVYGRNLSDEVSVYNMDTYNGLGTEDDYIRDRTAFTETYPVVELYLALEGGKLYLQVDNGHSVKFMSILEEAQKLWESFSTEGRLYKSACDMLKVLRKQGATFSNSQAVRTLTEQKNKYSVSSLWVATDKWLQDVGSPDKDIILSVNPFDHFMMAGGLNGGYTPASVVDTSDSGRTYHPTNFRTCWGVEFFYSSYDKDTVINAAGEYSAIIPMLAYGCVTTKAVMYVRNSKPPINIKVDGADLCLSGVEFRAHAFLVDDKIWFDMLYPKVVTGLRTTLKESLGDTYLTKAEFKDISRKQGLVDKYDNYYAIGMELLSDDATHEWFRVYDHYGANFLDGVAMDMYKEDAYIFFKDNLREKSARIQAGYDYEHDLSPLQKQGILEGGHTAPCNCCDDLIDLEDGDYYRVDDEIYCGSECLNDAGYVICERCGEIHSMDDSINPEGNCYYYCSERCAHYEGYMQCDHCQEWYHEDRMLTAETDGGDYYYYCSDECADREGFERCDACGELRNLEEGLCEDCRDTE